MVAFGRDIFVFGRRGGSRDEFARLLRILHQPVEHELRGALHQRECPSLKELAVLSEEIVVPQVLREPSQSHVPVAPLGTLALHAHGIGHCPDVAVMTGAEASIDAVVVAGRVAAVVGQCLHEGPEGLGHFREISHLGRPVVFFKVDVHGVVAVPGCVQVWVP